MKWLTYLLAIVAATAFTALPVLAKGGHSGGHPHSSGGHAHASGGHSHSSAGHAHPSAPHAAHHSAPHAAHKPTPNKSTAHSGHSVAPNANKPSNPNSTRISKPHTVGTTAQSHVKLPVNHSASRVASNPTTIPGNVASQPAPTTINQIRTTVNVGRQYSHYGMRHRYYGRHGYHRYSLRRVRANQAPSFVKGPDQVVAVNTGPQSVAPWATRISAGHGNGSRAGLSFQVTGDTRPGLFQTVPSVSPSGILSYTPAPGQTGTATITLVLRNNSSGMGSHNTSRPQSFNITVVAS